MASMPREVDARDTRWETSALDVRVFIQDEAGRRLTFDIDQISLQEAQQWAKSQAVENVSISIAMRTVNSSGQPGLIGWLKA